MERTNQARVSQPTNDLKYKYYQILLFWDSITKIKINLFIFDKPSIYIIYIRKICSELLQVNTCSKFMCIFYT
jgi:hypothetical protein